MAGFNVPAPPDTRNPEELVRYIRRMHESLSHVLMNIDVDNLGEDLAMRLKRIEEKLGIES